MFFEFRRKKILPRRGAIISRMSDFVYRSELESVTADTGATKQANICRLI